MVGDCVRRCAGPAHRAGHPPRRIPCAGTRRAGRGRAAVKEGVSAVGSKAADAPRCRMRGAAHGGGRRDGRDAALAAGSSGPQGGHCTLKDGCRARHAAVCVRRCVQAGRCNAGREAHACTRARSRESSRTGARPCSHVGSRICSLGPGSDLPLSDQIHESSIPHECRAYIPHESRASGPLPYGRGASSLGVGVGVGRGGGVSSPPASASSGLVTAMRRRAQTGGLRETPAHKPVRVFQSESSTPSESADGGTGGHAVSPSLFCNPKAVSPSFF